MVIRSKLLSASAIAGTGLPLVAGLYKIHPNVKYTSIRRPLKHEIRNPTIVRQSFPYKDIGGKAQAGPPGVCLPLAAVFIVRASSLRIQP